MIIEMPLPHKNLSPNARPHWAAKAKSAKKYRQDAFIAATDVINQRFPLGGRPPRMKKATAQCTFYMRSKRRVDADNLLASVKNCFDGFTDAGVWVDDQYVMHLPVVIGYDKLHPRVEIEVLEIT